MKYSFLFLLSTQIKLFFIAKITTVLYNTERETCFSINKKKNRKNCGNQTVF